MSVSSSVKLGQSNYEDSAHTEAPDVFGSLFGMLLE
jgi:hypothetical protein